MSGDEGASVMKPPFGVYVHWPFCASKCPYCDFNSHVRHKAVDQARFAKAFEQEIATVAARIGAREISSVFFGGGTPSLMMPETVGAILEALRRHWTLSVDVEITLEANPTSVEAERFRGYRAVGVNRVSLGVQSLNDDVLRFLGRRHTAREAIDAIAVAREHFKRYSFDLIYARPEQDAASWRRELDLAIDEAAEHLSLYQLTIEQGTPFFDLHRAGRLRMPEGDLARALFDETNAHCAARGLPSYEVSNYARPGAECRHNLLYWRYGEYAGIGPGAHGRLLIDGARRAVANEKNPERWLSMVETHGEGRLTDEALTRGEQADEFLLMGLRLAEGIDVARYEALSGQSLDPAQIAVLREQGLIEFCARGQLRVTQAGFPVLDAVVADLAA